MTQERALEVQELGGRTEYPMTQVEDAAMFDEVDHVEVFDQAVAEEASIRDGEIEVVEQDRELSINVEQPSVHVEEPSVHIEEPSVHIEEPFVNADKPSFHEEEIQEETIQIEESNEEFVCI